MPQFALRTLGGLALRRLDDGGDDLLANSKSLLILALLATRDGHEARREDLAELLWPGADRARALRALRQALFHLAGHAEEVLVRDEDVLRLDPDRLAVDLWAFDRALAEEDFARALALYEGRFAEGLERKVGTELEHWIEGVNSRIAVGLEVAYAREIARHGAAGAWDRAVALAREFVVGNPLDEQRQRLLIHTLLDAGDQLGALQAFEEYRMAAEGDLDEDVSPALAQRLEVLRDELLRPARAAAAETAAAAPPVPVATAQDPGAPLPLIAGAIAGTALLALAALGMPAGSRSGDALAPPDVRLLLTGPARDGELLEAVIAGGDLTVRPVADRRPDEMPAPNGAVVALATRAPDGWNLALRTAGRDEVRTLTTDPGDERPLAWSPDGRYLLVTQRRLPADGRSTSYTLAIYDTAADTAAPLSGSGSREPPAAAWSPDGTRIAYTADARGGAPDVFVVDFDGTGRRNLTAHAAWDGEPAWAPDGHRVVFVSRRGGGADLYTVRPDGTGLQRVTEIPAPVRSPQWVSPTAVVFLAGSNEGRDLWLVRTLTGDVRQLTRSRAFGELIGVAGVPAPWVDRVRIGPRVAAGSPGQYLGFRATLEGAGGEVLDGGGLPLRWRVSDRALATADDSGRVRLRAPGLVEVIASAAGWRADTLRILVIPLVEHALAPVFEETWRDGLQETRWRPFGDPAPRVRRRGAPGEAGIFLNGGDAFFASGVISREAFPLAQGLTVEVTGRMPFTGMLHQEFGVALYHEDHADSLLATGDAPALAEFRILGGSSAGPARAWIATPERRDELPVPERSDTWRRYTLQVLPDGAVELIVDGRLYWRSPYRVATRAAAAHVGLGFQSFGTEIQHGAVRVYAGRRYVLPDVPDASGERAAARSR